MAVAIVVIIVLVWGVITVRVWYGQTRN